jgi:hypothetical protein
MLFGREIAKTHTRHRQCEANSDVLDELAKLESSLKNASANHDPDKPSPNHTHAHNEIECIRMLLVKLAAAPDADAKIQQALMRIDLTTK